MLKNGMDFLMIPGPTTMPLEVLRAMHRPSIDIYDGPMVATTDSCLADLKKVFRTEAGHVYIYIANGHGAWDAALSNTLSRGDKVLVLDSGRFAREWGLAATKMGIDVEVVPGSWRAAVDPQAVLERLKRDTAGQIKAVMMVQVDTASGVINDVPAVRRAIDGANHPALFMVDVVASLGCVPFEMDNWRVDVAVAASQKGLMTPAGIAFVGASPKAHEVSKRADLRTRYMDWEERRGDEHYIKYGGTPPEQHMFALRAALDMIMAEGLDQVWKRHAILAGAVREAVDAWSTAGAIAFNIIEAAERSDAVSVFLIEGEQAGALRELIARTCAVTVGGTIGEIKGQGIRIGHMGHINAPMILGTLATLQAGFTALGIPFGPGGLDRAARHIGRAIAEP